MINYITGNLLESDAQALVNPVNLDGIMGKWIALAFKEQFPRNYKQYVIACLDNTISIGNLLVTISERSLFIEAKLIINFPTKTSWRLPSKYRYIDEGLKDLVRIINEYSITSIAIPALGCGDGGLDFDVVKILIEKHLSPTYCDIFVYLPL